MMIIYVNNRDIKSSDNKIAGFYLRALKLGI